MPGRTAVVVQARRASSRLPDKVLLDLQGRSILSHVLGRCKRIPGADAVVCAIPDSPGHEALAVEATRLGATVFAGSEEDVLGRYLGAARTVGADIVLRVTSDCPLIDPEVCGQVLDLRRRMDADYAANNLPPSWPHGLDCEAFTLATLQAANDHARPGPEREHVTPWIRANSAYRRVDLPGPGGAAVGERWTLDHPEDLAFLRALAGVADGDLGDLDWRAVTALLDAHPSLRAINAARRDPGRVAAP